MSSLNFKISCAASAVFLLAPAALAAGGEPVTFSRDIAPILQAKCQECHRVGSMAPMSLVTYQEARPWAKSIKQRVVTRQMPPWHLDKTVGVQHFRNDFSLSDEQIAAIVEWVDSGAPEGDPADMPPPKEWPDYGGWQLAKQFGEPDLVLKSEDYTMPARGQDVWFKPYTPVNIDEPRWVRAVEIRPGSDDGRKIMHHVLARLQQDEPGELDNDQAVDFGPGLLMEWAIGKNYDVYPSDTGKLLMPGAHISWELHMHAVGEEIRDHAELAVYLYPKGVVPEHRTRLSIFTATRTEGGAQMLDIPPNSEYVSQNYHVLRQNARLENFQPHMHLRGKAMSMEAILPSGERRLLSHVDKFNFNWMTNYIYAEDSTPILPKGTVLVITAWYDNTVNNRVNPDPDQWVGYGDRTVDEMGHAWVNVTYLTDEEYEAYQKQRSAAQRTGGGL